MNTADLRKKSKAELLEDLKKVRGDLEKSVKEVLNDKEKDKHAPRKLRKDIARIKTILAEKEVLENDA